MADIHILKGESGSAPLTIGYHGANYISDLADPYHSERFDEDITSKVHIFKEGPGMEREKRIYVAEESV